MAYNPIVKELARLYGSAHKVRNVLEDVGVDPASVLNPFGEMTPYEYWYYLVKEMDKGLVENGREKLRGIVLRDFPFNAFFKQLPGVGEAGEEAGPPAFAGKRCDIFLSYNSKDRAVVQYVGENLRKVGVEAWFDERELQGGMPIVSSLEKGLEGVKAVGIFLGGHGKGAWQEHEIAAAIYLNITRGTLVIPIVLPEAKIQDIPLFLQQFKAIPYRTNDDGEFADELARILNENSKK